MSASQRRRKREAALLKAFCATDGHLAAVVGCLSAAFDPVRYAQTARPPVDVGSKIP